MRASHSFWNSASIPGMLVACIGLGLTHLFAANDPPSAGGRHSLVVPLMEMRSSADSSSPDTGHFPVESMYFSISRRSNRYLHTLTRFKFDWACTKNAQSRRTLIWQSLLGPPASDRKSVTQDTPELGHSARSSTSSGKAPDRTSSQPGTTMES